MSYKKSSFFSRSFFDPEDAIWLEIVRVAGIMSNIVFIVFGVFYTVFGVGNLITFLGVLFIAFVFHITLMLSLNLMYNVHQIKRNSSITRIETEKISKLMQTYMSTSEKKDDQA